jgi:Ca2+/Na+ antiporter
LCVGGLFTAIGNKYIVESSVPSSSGNTLMDNVHNLTFIFILLIILVVTISLYFFETGNSQKRKLSLKIDIWSSLLFLLAYIVINMFMIYKATC